MPASLSCLQLSMKQKKPTSEAIQSYKIRGLKTGHDIVGDGSEASLLDDDLPRFGPIYGEDNGAMQEAKGSALEHILKSDQDTSDAFFSSIADIQMPVMRSYDVVGLTPGSEFEEKMVKDGCFFLLLALHILGAGEHLGFPDEDPYFGINRHSADWIPALFFVGNQIPVVKALMERSFFQNVMSKGKWGSPPQDPLKLALYRTVVEPQLDKSALLTRPEPPSDIVQALHRLLLGSGNIYSEMKEFPDLEAGEEDATRFPSAGELLKSGIRLRKTYKGITNINLGYILIHPGLYIPPLMIDRNTVHMLKCVASYEQNLNESDREVTAYLRLMRDLAPTYNDFKILEKNGIIQVKESEFKYQVMITLNDLVASHKCKFSLKFRDIRRKIKDYEKPPWELISLVLALITFSVNTVFAALSYFKHKK